MKSTFCALSLFSLLALGTLPVEEAMASGGDEVGDVLPEGERPVTASFALHGGNVSGGGGQTYLYRPGASFETRIGLNDCKTLKLGAFMEGMDDTDVGAKGALVVQRTCRPGNPLNTGLSAGLGIQERPYWEKQLDPDRYHEPIETGVDHSAAVMTLSVGAAVPIVDAQRIAVVLRTQAHGYFDYRVDSYASGGEVTQVEEQSDEGDNYSEPETTVVQYPHLALGSASGVVEFRRKGLRVSPVFGLGYQIRYSRAEDQDAFHGRIIASMGVDFR